jgi:hypothetical protein
MDRDSLQNFSAWKLRTISRTIGQYSTRGNVQDIKFLISTIGGRMDRPSRHCTSFQI